MRHHPNNSIDFRYIADVLTPCDAFDILGKLIRPRRSHRRNTPVGISRLYNFGRLARL
jgi:hypothetical protein